MKKAILLAAAAAALTLCGVAPSVSAQRLPELATPDHYQLRITTDFDKENFAGDETIDIRVLKPTSTIVLNAAEITFLETTVTSSGRTQTAKVAPEEKAERATLSVDAPLAAGPAQIHIRYTGILNGQLRGLYLSKANGRKYAVSQLENTDARRMYPSFDEPAYKATFDITAIIDKGDTAISNGKIVSDTPGPGDAKHTLKFGTTPKMSSYLVALLVGDWQCLEGGADGIPIRVCGVPGKKPYASFALEAAEFTMKFYNQYFGIKYPYEKLDIIGAPDFSAGAMENTGCIVARDIIFLDPQQASYGLRKSVAQQLVAHEMAHQWFGDLVTMKWWDDVWLNEGFATWMAFKPMAAWKPDWDLQTDEVSSATGAMATDSLAATRAIHAHAETPQEIEELFDSIAYNKAGAVLRMVEGYVGEGDFRKGVNSYLTKYAYANATAEDFWNELTRATGKPVDKIMSSFVKQPGVPLVSVKTACAGGKTKATISQQRYFTDRVQFDRGSSETWDIPVCLRAGKGEKCELLASKEQPIEMPGCGEAIWGNAGGRGYYRSSYDSEDFANLAKTVEGELGPGERYLMMDDAAAQAAVSRLPAGDFMALIGRMSADPSDSVIGVLSGQLQFVSDYLVADRERAQFEAWVRKTFSPVMEQIGWTPGANESDETRARRGNMVRILGIIGNDPKMLQFSRDLVDDALKGKEVDSTLLGAALSVAANKGDAKLYDAILAHFAQVKTPAEFLLYGQALCLFSDPALVTRTLTFAVSPQMRSQDAPQVISAVMSTRPGRQIAWDFIRQHWREVEAKLSNYSETTLVGAAAVFCDAASRDQVKDFFVEHKVPATDRALKLTLEQINACIDVRAHQEANLRSWLANQKNAQAGIARGGNAGK